MKQPWPIEQRSPIHAPAITCTKCQSLVSTPMCVSGPSTIAVGWMNGAFPPSLRCTSSRMTPAVPKRPPREARELPVPRDLRGAGPTRAHTTGAGELWHGDVLEVLGRTKDRSVDLVV